MVGAGIGTGVSTPALESSNATDDEREVKRARVEKEPVVGGASGHGNATPAGVIEGTPAASDEDEDDLEFENV